MHQIQIKIIKLQFSKAFFSSFGNVFLLIVPKLGSDKDFLSLNACLEAHLQSFSYRFFIPVDASSINVSVPILKNSFYYDVFAIFNSSRPKSHCRCLEPTTKLKIRAFHLSACFAFLHVFQKLIFDRELEISFKIRFNNSRLVSILLNRLLTFRFTQCLLLTCIFFLLCFQF